MPIMAAERAPKAWLKAVRCGTAVMCTRPSGMPTPAPMIRRDEDPFVLRYLGVEKCDDDRQRSADLAGQNAPARARRRTQELERKNEQNDRYDVGEIEVLLQPQFGHDFFGPRDLNMRSMRSVIRNPPTMLLNEAATAIAPKTVVSRVCMPAGDDDGGYHHDRVEGVGQRHEWCVEQRRNTPDHFEAHEPGQDEDIEVRNKIWWHDCSF